ncbi:30S ribosome-binding factor RbfA [Malaciobacter marinus]|uniref:Ribosome-binding factor A n=2 Tax=Malaciobacter marinus TaxID=505249 RepID=A0A347THP8_9BACT|nr:MULTISPECIES: 30S ribosome-binding factor RbfA [Malaciobacter]AXX86126.1 ribosome-binding factor A [Malaciobacter marinus]PHO11920.1 ribosome-binding factor A [Malaciobacter marinus]PHO15698.1 ribosome-binding factor A [Malaciobacter marinus]RYA24093.1 30S ribosome-binding factor RbfA [Malaciobacter halophilus]
MKSVNLQRTESLLMELVPEALATLKDSRINSLAVTGVDCKNGKYDATVYYDGTDYSKEEHRVINSLLNKANGHIKSHCLNSTGWYKCPNFKFKADDTLEHSMKMEALFEKIKSKKED